jgi:hypothetical protein
MSILKKRPIGIGDLKPMESYFLSARWLLGVILHEYRKHRFWHYGITLADSNPNSLAHLLGFTMDNYSFFMVCIGLMKVEKKSNRMLVLKKEWNRFLVEQKLIGKQTYFDRMDVN